MSSPKPHHPKIHLFQGYLLIAISLFLLLSLGAKYSPYFDFDLSISTHLQSFHSPPFLLLMKLVTFPGNFPQSLIFIFLSTLLLLQLKHRLEAIYTVLTFFSASLLDFVLKLAINRPRPPANLVNVVTHLQDSSFPSGHVFTYVAFYGFLAFLVFTLSPNSRRRTCILICLISLICLIGPSRVYLGEHWSSDVLGAYLIGSIWLLISIHFYHYLKHHLNSRAFPN